MIRTLSSDCGAMFCVVASVSAQEPDPEIVRYVNSIKAIDNHSHITALDRDHDKGYDQLRCDVLPPAAGLSPANFRFNADQQWAYKTLFGFDAKSGNDAEIKKIIAMELAARKEHGAGFYAWVMEKAGAGNCIRESNFDAAGNACAANSLGSV